MKKLVLTIAISLIMGITVFAQQDGGGALRRSKEYESYRKANNMRGDDARFWLPTHNTNGNWDAKDEPEAPLGGGVLLLVGFGAAYAMTKRKKED